MIEVLGFLSNENASRDTPEGLAGHMWPAGHGLSTTAVDGGPHGGEVPSCCFGRPCCFGHSEIFNLIFKNENTSNRPVHLNIVGKAVKRRLWRFSKFRDVYDNWNKFRMQIEHQKLCSWNSPRLLPTRVDSASRQECFDWSAKSTRLIPHEHVKIFLSQTCKVGSD